MNQRSFLEPQLCHNLISNHPSEGPCVWGHVQVITISRSWSSKSQQIIVLRPRAIDGADTKLSWAAANIYHFPHHSCWSWPSSIQFPQWQPEFDSSSYSEISSEFEAATVWCLSFTIWWRRKICKSSKFKFQTLYISSFCPLAPTAATKALEIIGAGSLLCFQTERN